MSTGTSPQPRPRPPVVLVIDDNVGDTQLVREAFDHLGAEAVITAVENVPQALSYLHRQPPFSAQPMPDLILLDLNMPMFHGHELLREMQVDPVWSGIPVIVFSSSRRDSDRRLSLDLGARRFVSKPTAWPDYLEAMRVIVEDLRAIAARG